MGIRTEIEIDRSPAQVRAVFLDFPSLPTWTNGFIKSIVPEDPVNVAPGTKLHNQMEGMAFSPTVLANTPQEFRWRGMLWSIPGLFTGEHEFRFEPSRVTPGGTTLVQAENFSGVLAFMIAEGTGFYKTTRDGFEGFNVALKKRCESSK